MLSSLVSLPFGMIDAALAVPSDVFREYIDNFDGYTLKYPQNWIQVRGSGADIFFRDPFVLAENVSVDISSPSSSRYKSVEDLGSPAKAGERVLKQYLTEFMSTRLGVRRESNILSTSSKVADDGKLYYQIEFAWGHPGINLASISVKLLSSKHLFPTQNQKVAFARSKTS
ncbi:PsbP domain-containing protein 1, chloroplastic [Asimina triloba]